MDTYLPQFEAAVREGRVASVMAAYNRLNGEACAASPTLLSQILRERWGFDGYVVGDCGAVDDIYSGHRLTRSREAAAAAALRAGTDLDCGSGLPDAGAARIARGLVTEADLDRRAGAPLHGALPAGAVRSARRGCPGRGSGATRSSRRPTWRSRARPRRGRSCCWRTAAARCRWGRRCAGWRWSGPPPTTCPCCSATTTARRRGP